MKKFLVAAVVSVAVLAGTIPAHADNSENVIIGILGGALGGLIVGEVIGGNHNTCVCEGKNWNHKEGTDWVKLMF